MSMVQKYFMEDGESHFFISIFDCFTTIYQGVSGFQKKDQRRYKQQHAQALGAKVCTCYLTHQAPAPWQVNPSGIRQSKIVKYCIVKVQCNLMGLHYCVLLYISFLFIPRLQRSKKCHIRCSWN